MYLVTFELTVTEPTPEEEETPVTYEDTSSSFTDIEPKEKVAITPQILIASVLYVGFIETEPTWPVAWILADGE